MPHQKKPLLDFIYLKEAKGEFKNQKEFFNYILASYRLDMKAIESQVSLKKMQAFAEPYPYRHVQWFANELTRKLLK